ncbi:MAG: hypothetical protein IKQ60_08430 [Candidatus Methanomethylophilaceae archaeon]|nr:hypothetical protein [Candidatus Methanomethylophilaceae archaeon]
MTSVISFLARNFASRTVGIKGDQSEWSGPDAHFIPSSMGRYLLLESADSMDQLVTASYPIGGRWSPNTDLRALA